MIQLIIIHYSPKVVKPTNKKRYHNTMRTSVKKQSNVLSLPGTESYQIFLFSEFKGCLEMQDGFVKFVQLQQSRSKIKMA